MKVLIADDQNEVRSALRLSLEQSFPEITVKEITRAESLDREIADSEFALMLLDWEMPGMEDQRLRADVLAHWSTIVLSATPTSRQQALALGAREFVCKSDPPETILHAVQRLMPGAAMR